MLTDLFPGFRQVSIPVPDAVINAVVGGAGPPLLLLHGYPQTLAMWSGVIEGLAAEYTVVATDLRGYGDSRYTGDKDTDAAYTFRAFAADQVTVMGELGYANFAVAAHDRGARTAHRLMRDRPGVVTRAALMDILPTADVWRLMNDWLALRYFHWLFLAQPGNFAEKLIAADPDTYLNHALGSLGGAYYMDPRAVAEYRRCFAQPGTIRAVCRDYRAAATIDREHDGADADNRIDTPLQILWGANGVVGKQEDPIAVWGRVARCVQGEAIEAGHFLLEERPQDVLNALLPFLREDRDEFTK
jgi:haloacetate dehalogenase